MSDNTKISKFLSLVLRHKPEEVGLTLDKGGWADVDELLAKLPAKLGATKDRLRDVVSSNDKQRFSFSEDGTRIRANQGHSKSVELGLEPVEPPDVLWHGTATRNLESILVEGLKPGSRQYVHLSPDQGTALKVGQRHGKPVILRIDTAGAHAAGQVFYRAANGVWLTDALSADWLTQTGKK